MVHASVVAELPGPGELLVRTRDRYGPAAHDLRDLPGNLTDGASRRRDDHGIARLRPPLIEQREISGEPRESKHGERVLYRALRRIDLAQAGTG
jgi:hypothetical protein